MIILAALAAACVTGALFALVARTQGIHHPGLLFAIGVIAAGVQLLVLIAWFLADDKRRWRAYQESRRVSDQDAEPRPGERGPAD